MSLPSIDQLQTIVDNLYLRAPIINNKNIEALKKLAKSWSEILQKKYPEVPIDEWKNTLGNKKLAWVIIESKNQIEHIQKVVKKTLELEENIKSLREHISYGQRLMLIEILRTMDHSSCSWDQVLTEEDLDMLLKKEELINQIGYLKVTSELTLLYKGGNCFEYSGLVFEQLRRENPRYWITRFSLLNKDCNHAFVILSQSQIKEVTQDQQVKGVQIGAYDIPLDAIFVDIWNDKLVSSLEQLQKDTERFKLYTEGWTSSDKFELAPDEKVDSSIAQIYFEKGVQALSNLTTPENIAQIKQQIKCFIKQQMEKIICIKSLLSEFSHNDPDNNTEICSRLIKLIWKAERIPEDDLLNVELYKISRDCMFHLNHYQPNEKNSDLTKKIKKLLLEFIMFRTNG